MMEMCGWNSTHSVVTQKRFLCFNIIAFYHTVFNSFCYDSKRCVLLSVQYFSAAYIPICVKTEERKLSLSCVGFHLHV
uniref:Uncharacterized protein n=1 Tax=Timema poppense TaxID=170557 RepID=A0A7R9H3W7_TIMPO|nr:unnamed protein product [Timema poppensis]